MDDSRKFLSSLLGGVFLTLFSCAHPYSIHPLGDDFKRIDGKEYQESRTKKCSLLAAHQTSTPHELLIGLRVTNLSSSSFDLDPTQFTLEGPKETLKEGPLPSQDPDRYLQELRSLTSTLEARTKMDSYRGVEELSALTGQDSSSDKTIDRAKDLHKDKQKDAARAAEEAKEVRSRIQMIEPLVFKKSTVKPGETLQGSIIIRARFGETGVVDLVHSGTPCEGRIRFMLKK